MHDDHVDVGASPPMEACAQVGSRGYFGQARKECRAYVALLRRALGTEPKGARLAVWSSPHDFGSYLSVACHFEAGNEAAAEYALRCESEGPECWDAIARRELGLPPTTEEGGNDDQE
jgi:hypothetical protein